jgi:hypothetical protein
MEFFMKIVRFLAFFSCLCIVLANTSVDAMKRLRETEIIQLRCKHLDEFIEVSQSILKHSSLLNNLLIKSAQAVRNAIPVDVSDQGILQAIVDCLTIIESGKDVENSLLAYLFDISKKYTPEDRKNLNIAGNNLGITKLCESFKNYPAYVRKKMNDSQNQKLDFIIQKALAVFEKVEDKKNAAIVIDIDDCALSRLHKLGAIEVNDVVTTIPHLQAIEKVRDCYKKIVTMGFKIFFLTARQEKTSFDLAWSDCYEATVKNLKIEGYDLFEKVICVPVEKREQMMKEADGDNDLFVDLHAKWKEAERNKIAEKFTIAGTLDDTPENLQGDNVGHAVLIPRFF